MGKDRSQPTSDESQEITSSPAISKVTRAPGVEAGAATARPGAAIPRLAGPDEEEDATTKFQRPSEQRLSEDHGDTVRRRPIRRPLPASDAEATLATEQHAHEPDQGATLAMESQTTLPTPGMLDSVAELDEPFASMAIDVIVVLDDPARDQHRERTPLAEGDVVAHRYRVAARLAASEMSILYRAVDLETERMVVIKLLHGRVAENLEAVARFQREARLMARVRSEHVAKVLDAGFHERSPFIVMELLEGSDLAQLLKQVGRLPLNQAADLLLQLCEALAVAHAHGIVHRDLKPANVFVSVRAGGELRVTIIDFGIAKAFVAEDHEDAVVTRNGLLIGSPRYMAPEQVERRSDIDARADIWALGVILQEVLTGQPAFEGEGVVATLLAVATKPPTPIRDQLPDVPEAIEQLVERALTKDRAGRPPNVLVFAMQIAAFGSVDASKCVERIAAHVYFGNSAPATLVEPPKKRASGLPRPVASAAALHPRASVTSRVEPAPARRLPIFVIVGMAVLFFGAAAIAIGVLRSRWAVRPLSEPATSAPTTVDRLSEPNLATPPPSNAASGPNRVPATPF